MRRTIVSDLASLSEGRRLAITLAGGKGFSYEETTLGMNCSLGTVKSQIS